MIPVQQARDFVKIAKGICKHSIYIELDFAGNKYEMISSPRGHYVAYGIVQFLNHAYKDHKTILKDE